jgi:hypothetical protein
MTGAYRGTRNMGTDRKCHHGKFYYDHCEACGAEYRHLRADLKRSDAAVAATARALGCTQTVIAKDGCEVTATPDGQVFYNMGDWY